MKAVLPSLVLATLLALGAPAHAGVADMDLPRLTFPEPPGPTVDRDCTLPALPGAADCGASGG